MSHAATTTDRAGVMVTDVDRKPRAPSPAADIRLWLAALVEVLQAPIRVCAFTMSLGCRQELSRLAVPIVALPRRLVEVMLDGDEVRASVLSEAIGAARLAAAFARWHLPARITPASRWQVDEEARAVVAAALRDLSSAPTAVIEAGQAVIALWLFTTPITLPADEARVLALQRRLAQRLGADVESGQDLGAYLPLPGGGVRNWNRSPLEYARFDLLDVARRYTIEQLEQAATATTAAPAARRRDRA